MNESSNDSYWVFSAVNTDDDYHHQNLSFPDIGDDELNTLMPQWAYLLASVYLSFVTVMGLTLNGAIILTILRDPQQKTPLNWMLLNLAFSDGIISAFGTPISAVVAANGGWHLSHEMCVTYAMVMSITGIASITILCVLALWRCTLVVLSPVKRHLTGTRGRVGSQQAFLLSFLVWAYAGAVTSPPLMGWGRYDLEAAHISCSVNWESRMDNNQSYIMYLFALGLVVPLTIIIASYISIIHVLRKTRKMKQKLIRHHFSTTPPLQVRANEGAERRVTKMVACMVGTFMVSWTPYSVLALMETFGSFAISPAVATIPSLFAKTSVVFNPLVYGLLNTQFRSSVFSSLRLSYLKGSNTAGSNNNQNNMNNNDGVPGIKDGDHPAIIDNSKAHRPSPANQIEMNAAAIPTSSKKSDDDKGKRELFLLETTTIYDKKNNYVSMVGSFGDKKRKGFNHPGLVNMDSFDTGFTSITSTMIFKNDQGTKNTIVTTGCHCHDGNNHECGETVVVIATERARNWSPNAYHNHDIRPV